MFENTKKSLANLIGLLLRFDPIGELAIPLDENLDYLLYGSFLSKTSYYVSRRNTCKLQKLQKEFDKLNLNAMTISEGKKIRFGPLQTPMVVITEEEAKMTGYKNIHIQDKNHSEINKVANEKDPTFIAINEFIANSLQKNNK